MKKVTIIICCCIYATVTGIFIKNLFEDPVVDGYGVTTLVYNQQLDVFEANFDGLIYEVKKIDRGRQRTLCEGMDIYYLYLEDVLYTSSECLKFDEWAKKEHRERYIWFVVFCFVLFVAFIFSFLAERIENTDEC
ncbi:MAG: hypothetical protein IKL33_01190 [Alphaproteobacteria bacterium]|nr:hypothetical protein [Alphaproteobacteria bacterium]